MEKSKFSVRIFNGSFGFAGERDGVVSLAAAKKYAAKAQNEAGYGWHAEIRDGETGSVVMSRSYGARKFAEHI